MTDRSAMARLRAALPSDEVTGAAVSLWVVALAGVAAPAAALAGGPRPPTTAVGATQVLLVALAPVALAYVPYAVREVRAATASDLTAGATAAAAALAALAVAAGLRSLVGDPATAVPALALALPAFGVWLHRRGDRVGDAEAWLVDTVPTREDLRRPDRLLADRERASNVAFVVADAVVLAAAANLAWRLTAAGTLAAWAVVAAVAYGGWYVGQAFAIRAGLWQPWRGP